MLNICFEFRVPHVIKSMFLRLIVGTCIMYLRATAFSLLTLLRSIDVLCYVMYTTHCADVVDSLCDLDSIRRMDW